MTREELRSLSSHNDKQHQLPKGFIEKTRIIFLNVTVEPIVVLYLIPSVMSIITVQNLNLEKGCRVNLNLNSDICDGLAARNSSAYNVTDEAAVQKLVASMYIGKSIVQSIFPAILLMFLGSWSDRHNKRKACIILPIGGDCISCVGFLLCTYFFYELSMEYSVLSDTIPPAIMGGWFIMNMAAFSYIGENSSIETRTIRVGAVSLLCNISMPIGLSVSGILYNKIGFYGVFSLSLTMLLAGATYGIIRITDKHKGKVLTSNRKIGFLRDFFDAKHLKDTLSIAFKKDGKNRRKRVCLIMIILLVVVRPFQGEFGVLYLSVRYRFQWNEVDYSIYCAYNFIIQTIGTLFSLTFFSKFLKLDDALLGAISSSSKFIACFVYAFAPNSTVFYLGTVTEMLNGTSFIAMRSIISKLGPPEEIEKAKSIEAELQTLATQDDNTINNIKPKTFLQKTKIIFCNITVEPVMVLYILPSVMASIATQNLNLEKACRVNLKLNEEICDGLAERNTSRYNTSDEVDVQKLVASMYAWRTVVQSLVPAIILMFLGSWSDRRRRRKPCILCPILGEILTCTGFLLCTYFFYELPMEFNGIVEAVPPALTGGWFAMFMGVYAYISGISNMETRTIRIGAVNMFSNVSLTIGIALSGILYKKIGFYGVFSTALTMYLTGIIYGFFRIKEHNQDDEIKTKEENVSFIKDFFNLQHISETFQVAFKEGERNRKKRICTIMILVMVIIGPMHGELGVMYLFVRYRFQWNEIDYSIYSTYTFILHMIGTLFSLAFFSKFLKMDDALLGVISSSSKVLSCFVYAFAPTSTIFYIGAVVEMLNGTSFIAMRSIMSKLVPPDELGKINSLFGVSEALMPLVYGPMYSVVYKATINVLPGTFFLLGGVLTFPAIIIFFWLYTENRRDAREAKLYIAQKENLLTKEKIKTNRI
ncbi:hypothetical protein ILUMI_21934, partial [Ignelater luminosus]